MVRFLRIASYVFLGASVLCGITYLATSWYRHERGEFPFLLEVLHVWLVLTMLATPLACGLLGVLALVLVFHAGPADRGTLLKSMGAFVVACVVATTMLLATPGGLTKPRRAEFASLAEGAEPLIEAIEQYERDNAHPPYLLAALVPDYLPVVPKTGHSRYPVFEYDYYDPGEGRASLVWYVIGDSGSTFDFDYPQCGPTDKSVLVFIVEDGERIVAMDTDRLSLGGEVEPFDSERWSLHPEDRVPMIESLLSRTDFCGMKLEAVRRMLGQWDGTASFPPLPAEGVTWELRVPCSLGLFNWDSFFYWPTEGYPERMGSDSTERIGRWAYLHE